MPDQGGGRENQPVRQHETHAGAARSVNAETALFPFLYAFIEGHLVVALPIRATQLTSDPLLLGLVGTTFQGTLVLFCALCGRISDHVPRWKMRVAGAFLCSTALFAMCVARGIVPLIALGGLLGVAGALYWPSLEASIAEHAPRGQLARSLSAFNLSWSAGGASGSFLSGALMRSGILVPFVSAGLTGLVLGSVLSWRYTRLQPRLQDAGPADEPQGREEYDPRARRFLMLARVGAFGIYFTVGSIRWLFPKLGLSLALSPDRIALLMGLMMASETAVFVAMGRFRAWEFSGVPFFLFGAVALGAPLAIAGGSSMPAFVVGFCLLGGCAGVLYTMALFYSVHSPQNKGANAGLHEAIIGSGALVGPLLGGGVARLAGLRAPLVLCAGVILLATCVQAGMWSRAGGRGTSSERAPTRDQRRA